MILLTSKFSENFENVSLQTMKTMELEKDDLHCAKVYNNEEYIEVFSPTVFETVEVYTSSSDNSSENQDISGITSRFETDDSNGSDLISAINMDSIDTVSSLENLEPGTYTLDVLESNDFSFDAVFVNDDNAVPDNQQQPLNITHGTVVSKSCEIKETVPIREEKKQSTETLKKFYKLRNCVNGRNSSRKIASTKFAKNESAREFLNKFSNDLSKSETVNRIQKENEEESRSLSWLLDFKISSIFNSVEAESDTTEKQKKKSNESSQKKPGYTYTELIEQALKENGELTVSGIYNWISNHYPYFQQHDDRWKNSVRHNLSINPQFRKGKKASQGAGHFWNISDSLPQNFEIKETVKKAIVRNIINDFDEEVLAATKSIQETENMDFTDVTDVSLHDAAEQLQIDNKQSESSLNITKSDIDQFWESAGDISDQRFPSFSSLIREISEESDCTLEENFLIQDIHNSICLGDELFSNGLNSPYYGLTTI